MDWIVKGFVKSLWVLCCVSNSVLITAVRRDSGGTRVAVSTIFNESPFLWFPALIKTRTPLNWHSERNVQKKTEMCRQTQYMWINTVFYLTISLTLSVGVIDCVCPVVDLWMVSENTDGIVEYSHKNGIYIIMQNIKKNLMKTIIRLTRKLKGFYNNMSI